MKKYCITVCRISFYDLSKHAVESTAQSETKITWLTIKDHLGDLMYQISSMKFRVIYNVTGIMQR